MNSKWVPKVIVLVLLLACGGTGCAALGKGAKAQQTIKPPRITANVSWLFTESVTGKPFKWTTHLECKSTDSRTWMVVPDVVFFEDPNTVGGVPVAAFAAQQEGRPLGGWGGINVVHVNADPKETNSDFLVTFVAILKQGTLDDKFIAHLSVGGKPSRWLPTRLKHGSSLALDWQALHLAVRNEDLRKPCHLGPIFYVANDPKGSSYLLVAKSSGKRNGDKWLCSSTEFAALSQTYLARQIDDSSKTAAWRIVFLNLLWDQPRPAKDANKILLRVFDDSSYPASLRTSAVEGLAARGYQPAYQSVAAVVKNQEADEDLRKAAIGCVAKLGSSAWRPVLTKIEADTSESDAIRSTARGVLAEKRVTK